MRENLKRERKERGLSQRAVAEYLQMSERIYKFIESGDRIGSIETWDKLEDLFNVHQRILRQNFDPKDSQ